MQVAGGILSSSHSVDVASVELVDSLSVNVSIFLDTFLLKKFD
jgi:hypothetical protein